MAELFNIHMASDLSEWSSTTTTSPNTLAYDASSGQGGTTGGGKIVINSSTNASYFVQTFTALSTETDLRFRWYANDLTALSIPSGQKIDLWRIYSNGNATQRSYGRIHNNTGTLQLVHSIRNDAGSFPSETVTWGTMPSYIEVHMHKGSGDAFQKVYFDGVLMGSGVTGETVSTTFIYDALRIGAPQISSASTTGTIVVDEVVARNDSTEIGSTNAAPVNTVPGTQTCTFGTQKSVTGVSVSDTNLSTIRVTNTGNATCTVTLSGSVTITAGTNGTNDFTIGTGASVAELNTVIGTLKTDNAIPAWPTRTASTTISIISSDGTLTDTDTITCNWTVPTGVGTACLYLTGTQAQINAALATAEITATETGTIQCLMYSVTSTPLTDTDTFNITVSEMSTGPVNEVLYVIVRRRRQRRTRREERRARR